jgi:type III pantothenate kinase
MLLALDIGNSAVKGALFDGETLRQVFHVDVPPPETSGEGRADRWQQALGAHLSAVSVDRTGIVSVVPEAVPAAEAALGSLTRGPVVVVDAFMRLPFTLDYETPRTLGTDRLAAAAAAWTRYGAPASRSIIAIDAGTAVNYEVVDHGAVYRGGAIGAGPALTQQALRSGTAQLPTVPLQVPSAAMGTSTHTAMQSGILYGFIDGVCGMVNRLGDALDDTPCVVLTGGWSAVLADRMPHVDRVEPHLVLDGVRILLDLNLD